jgi:hypothetical protein
MPSGDHIFNHLTSESEAKILEELELEQLLLFKRVKIQPEEISIWEQFLQSLSE